MLGVVRRTRKCVARPPSTRYLERGSPIGTVILSYKADDCKSFQRRQGSIARTRQFLAVCCADAKASRFASARSDVITGPPALLDSRMNFASDNTAGMAPEILQALVAANEGFVLGYGNDEMTRRVERRIGELFEREVAVFLVPTGTAANALALAHVSPPWGAVFAHSEAHILTDECGAPEFFGARAQARRIAGHRLQAGAADAGRRRLRTTPAMRRIRWCRRRCRSRRRPRPEPSTGRTRFRRWRRSRTPAA